MNFSTLKIRPANKPAVGIRPRGLTLYILSLALCFLLFQQSDLLHTTSSSYAYLNGHFLDFYDYNKQIFGGNDYLPVIYLIFAIWNIPLYLLNLTSDLTAINFVHLPVIEILWAKLLLVLFFYGTTIAIYKTSIVITEGKPDQARLISALFATSPIAIFAVFIFGQYDIIGLFFCMVGFYYYIRKDLNRFAWFFSIAISFKYFPLVIFIPLLLLAEKRLLKAIKLGTIALSFTALQIILYWNNEAFQERFLALPAGKVTATGDSWLSFSNYQMYLVAAYLIVCVFAFLKKTDNKNQLSKIAILISIIAYALMFSAVVWHPQWLIIVMPFFSFSYLYVSDKKKLGFIDIIGMLAFIWWVVNLWPNHVDVAMLSLGAFSRYFEHTALINADLMPISLLPTFKILFYLYLFSPVLLITLEHIKAKSSSNLDLSGGWFKARFSLGLAVFIIPSLFCALVPLSVALKINSQAFLRYLAPGLALEQPQKPIGEIWKEEIATQTFIAEKNNLSAVAVMFATYERSIDATVRFTLLAEDGTEITSQSLNGTKLQDNNFHAFQFPAISDSAGKTFQLQISSPDGKPGNAITVWMSDSDIYPNGTLRLNHSIIIGDLAMRLYYLVGPE